MDIGRIECSSAVIQRDWDELTVKLGGSFFHCYAHGMLESARPGVKPLFIKAFDSEGECVGVAVGSVVSPRMWPFSRYSRTVVFGALPATKDQSPVTQRAIMMAVKKKLRRIGIYEISVCSYDSLNSVSVLPPLGYVLKDRFEFYLDLARPLETIWKTLKGARRTDIRKANSLGVETRTDDTITGLRLLDKFEAISAQRHGVAFQAMDAQVESATATLLASGRAVLLVSSHDGAPMNAALFGLFGGRAYYLHSGSSLAGNKCCGPVQLLWTMVEMLQARGSTVLNLGGVTASGRGHTSVDGLYSFKKDFGTTIVYQPAGTKIISQKGAALHSLLTSFKQAANGPA